MASLSVKMLAELYFDLNQRTSPHVLICNYRLCSADSTSAFIGCLFQSCIFSLLDCMPYPAT